MAGSKVSALTFAGALATTDLLYIAQDIGGGFFFEHKLAVGTLDARYQASLGFTPVPDTRTISTTAPLTGGGNLTADRTLAIPQATGGVDGYLAAADFTIFNAKVSATRAINTTAPLTGGGDLSADRTLGIPKSTAAADGYLAAADFVTFSAGVQTAASKVFNYQSFS